MFASGLAEKFAEHKWDIESVLAKVFCLSATLVVSYLLITTMNSTWLNPEPSWDIAYYTKDSFLLNLLFLIFVIAIFRAVLWSCRKVNLKFKIDYFAALVIALAVILSIYATYAIGAIPSADQANCLACASKFNHGDYMDLGRGEYVGRYQQQLGLITVHRLLFILFGDWNYIPYQLLSCVTVGVIIFGELQIVRILTNKIAPQVILLLINLFCIPTYFYAGFVYGEIISTGCLVIAAWLCLKDFNAVNGIAITFCSFLAVIVRKNSLIVLIAFLIAEILHISPGTYRHKQNKQSLAIIFCILMGIIFSSTSMTLLYKNVIPADSQPQPMILHIVMGLNDDDGGPGWFNDYGYKTFERCDFDAQLALETGLQDLKLKLNDMKSAPFETLNFFRRKIASQWNAPMYQVFTLARGDSVRNTPLAKKIHEGGTYTDFVNEWTNLHQMLVYLGVLCALLLQCFNWKELKRYILLIGVFGGFLFSIMWEAKSRYVYPYFLMMMPYAAIGLYAAAVSSANTFINKGHKD